MDTDRMDNTDLKIMYFNAQCQGQPTHVRKSGICYKTTGPPSRPYKSYYFERCTHYDASLNFDAPAPFEDHDGLRSIYSNGDDERKDDVEWFYYVIMAVIVLLVFGIGTFCGHKIYQNGTNGCCCKAY